MKKFIFKNLLLGICILGACLLFHSCEKEELSLSEETVNSQLERIPPDIPKVLDPRKLENLLTGNERGNQTVTLKKGWNIVTTLYPATLNQFDTEITIKPTKGVSFRTVAIPSWQIVQSSYVAPYTSKTHLITSNTLPSGQTSLRVYIYSWTNWNSCNITTTQTATTNCSAPFPTSFRVGIDCGNAINTNTGASQMNTTYHGLGTQNRMQLIDDSDAKFVRINFYKPKYAAAGYGWISKYDDIVDDFICLGIPIYAVVTDVVGGTNVPGRETSYPTSGNGYSQDTWINNYVAGLTEIVNHFGSKITIYETFNEPNAYAENNLDDRAAMTPQKFASLLKKSYNAVGNLVTLVSGPVLAHDHGPYIACPGTNVFDNGSCYLKTAIEANYGQAYFDAVGYHIYVKEYSSNKAVIESSVISSITALRNMLASKWMSNKEVHISEIGWDSAKVNEWNQSNNMKYAIDKLRSVRHANKIASICHFAIADFPNKSFGLVTPQYMTNPRKKAAFNNFRYNLVKQ